MPGRGSVSRVTQDPNVWRPQILGQVPETTCHVSATWARLFRNRGVLSRVSPGAASQSPNTRPARATPIPLPEGCHTEISFHSIQPVSLPVTGSLADTRMILKDITIVNTH